MVWEWGRGQRELAAHRVDALPTIKGSNLILTRIPASVLRDF